MEPGLPVAPPGGPEPIGGAVAFPASERAGNPSGTVITIDGGAAARG